MPNANLFSMNRILVGSLFCTLGGAACLLAFRAWLRGQSAYGWPRTWGEIISSEVVRVEDNEGPDYFRAVVRYRYGVGGKMLIGDRVRHGDAGEMLSEAPALACVAKYPRGKQVTVRYDPRRPADAVIEPGGRAVVKSWLLWGAISLAFGAAILAGVVPINE